MFTFGYPIEGPLWWGARAIYKGHRDNYLIDMLRDRQSSRGFDDGTVSAQERNAFMTWLNKRALPWLRKEVKRLALAPNEEKLIVFREWKYELRANTNRSHGYLYIGAAMLEVEEIEPVKNKASGQMERVFKVGEQTYVWGKDHDPPLVGTEGTVRVNQIGPGVVVGYFTEPYGDEHQLLCLQVDLHEPPDWWINQTTSRNIKEAVKRGELQAKRGTNIEHGVPSPTALKEWKKTFELPPCIVWDGDFKLEESALTG